MAEAGADTVRSRDGTARGAALLGPAMVAANALHWLAAVVASRLLGPGPYGGLAALLGLVLAGTVPGIALQSVAARRSARGDAATPWAALLPAVAASGVALAAIAVVAAPALATVLRLGSPVPALLVAVCVAPLPLLSVLHGLLQGRGRWTGLAAVLVGGAAVKLAAGTALLLAGAGAPGAMLGAALGYAAEVAIAWTLVAPTRGAAGGPPGSAAPLRAGAAAAAPLRAELAPALAGVLALTVLANLDLLLARAVLDDVASGRYAVGSVIAKVAYWAPQAVVVVAYPRLAAAGDPGAVLRRGAAAVAALGGAVTAGAALTGPWLVPLVFGTAYAPVVAHLWRFGLLGTALALAQLLLWAGLARGRHAVVGVLAAGCAAAAALLLGPAPATVAGLSGTALGVVAATAGAAALALRGDPPEPLRERPRASATVGAARR